VRAIGIIGFGALGRQILSLLSAQQRPERVIYFDDPLHAQGGEDRFPFNAFLEPRFADHEFYVGLGYLHLGRKLEILGQLQAANRRLPAFVHPSCHVAAGCRIGSGCFIYPGCNLDEESILGEGVLLHNSVVVSHQSHIGPAAYLAPGVVLSGHVQIGAATFLGTGTLVANHRRIGARSRVGIGTVVTRDIPDEASVVGNPQRPVSHPLKLD
jgi:sugar O-acyltransferase (sialic acid O-acetyltransferase NeuD family)